MLRKGFAWVYVLSLLSFFGDMHAQTVNIYPIKNAKSLLVGGVITDRSKLHIALTKNTSEQVIVTASPEGASIASTLSFPYKFFVLNTFSQGDLRLTVGEVYPKVNIKEVSFISLLDQNGSVNDYKLFTVENGFSEIFDATLVDGNTLAIAGMGEIKVVTAYSLVPASAMLPQGLLIVTYPNLTFKKAYYITFPGQNRYVWRLYRIEALPKGEIIVAGEAYSEWDEERNSPLNTTPFVARISPNGSIRWAFTIPTHGHVNELIIADDGSVWLIYTDAKLSGSYLVNINSQDGSINSSLFVKGFTTNNAIIVGNQVICAGKLQTGKNIEAGIIAVNTTNSQVSKNAISTLVSNIPEGLKVSPMDIKVFIDGGDIGFVASMLGSTGDKSFIVVKGVTTDKLVSSQTAETAQKINVETNKETNISLEETKITELTEIKGDLKNEKVRIK